MIHRGKLFIIPDEEQILQGLFEYSVEQGKSHTKGIQVFSDMYQLGYQFSEEDYQEAPCLIASMGHMVMKTDDDTSLAIFYLPERITERQNNWIYENQPMLNTYVHVNAYSKNGNKWDALHGMYEIKLEANRKNCEIESIKN